MVVSTNRPSLKHLRVEVRHFTQEDLARAADLSVRGIQVLEAGGVKRPRRRTVRALARALAVDEALLSRIFENDAGEVQAAS